MSAAKSTFAGVNRVHQAVVERGRVRRAARRAGGGPARAAAELYRYPDGDALELRRAIGARFGLDPARIVCGAGSDDLIYQLCLAYGGPGATSSCPSTVSPSTRSPAPMPGAGDQDAGAQPDGGCRRDAGGGLAGDAAGLPGQPEQPHRAACCRQNEVQRLRAGLPPEVLLVLDAAYAEYVERPDYDPASRLVNAGDNTVMTRTFSKIFGLGGMRIGWAYAPPAVIDVLNRVRAPFNVSLASQAAAIAALAEPGWVEKGRAHNREYRAEADARAGGRRGSRSGRARAISCWPISARRTAPRRPMRSCARRGIIVRPVGAYGAAALPAHHRRAAEEVEQVIERSARVHGGERMGKPLFERLALIGIGLIGSSVARIARERGDLAREVVACARTQATLRSRAGAGYRGSGGARSGARGRGRGLRHAVRAGGGVRRVGRRDRAASGAGRHPDGCRLDQAVGDPRCRAAGAGGGAFRAGASAGGHRVFRSGCRLQRRCSRAAGR